MTPELVVNRFLDAARAFGESADGRQRWLAALSSDADLLGRWLLLMECPADPAALADVLAQHEPESLYQLAQTQVGLELPSASARLSVEQWFVALRAAFLGECLAEAMELPRLPCVRWQLLLASSGFHLPHDPVVDELASLRGAAPELLEDAAPLLRVAAVVDAPVEQGAELAESLLNISPTDFSRHVEEARRRAADLAASIGVEDEDGSAAEQLWARQRVLLAGRLFAQADSPSSLVELHKLVGAQIFRHVPYLLMVDPERDALEPAAEPGIGILVSSKTSKLTFIVELIVQI